MKKNYQIVVNGKYCYLSILKPKKIIRNYKLRFKVNKLKIVNDIPKIQNTKNIYRGSNKKIFFWDIF